VGPHRVWTHSSSSNEPDVGHSGLNQGPFGPGSVQRRISNSLIPGSAFRNGKSCPSGGSGGDLRWLRR
jgi:hypothetical protein